MKKIMLIILLIIGLLSCKKEENNEFIQPKKDIIEEQDSNYRQIVVRYLWYESYRNYYGIYTNKILSTWDKSHNLILNYIELNDFAKLHTKLERKENKEFRDTIIYTQVMTNGEYYEDYLIW